jgi:hypothetical protein
VSGNPGCQVHTCDRLPGAQFLFQKKSNTEGLIPPCGREATCGSALQSSSQDALERPALRSFPPRHAGSPAGNFATGLNGAILCEPAPVHLRLQH